MNTTPATIAMPPDPPTMRLSDLPKPIQRLLEKRYSSSRKRRFKHLSTISGPESLAFRDNFLKQHGLRAE